MERGTRGQSETVGVVLLTGVFVVLAVVIGTFLLSNFDGSDETTETVDVHSESNGSHIIIEHRGGDSYEASEIRMVFQQETGENLQYTLNDGNFSLETNGDNRTFSPGDRWTKPIDGLDGHVRLLVFVTTSDQLIHEATYVVSEA
ncbi:MAG: FlaG/FlaF family flagellin (archaellin) [Natronomonas sp.]|jgi:FlaG/FlaF family flagellin (archaellin)